MEAAAAPGFPPAAGLRNLRMPHFHLIRRRGPGPLGKGEKSPPTQERAAAALGKHRGRSTPSSLLGEQLGGPAVGGPELWGSPHSRVTVPGPIPRAQGPFPQGGGPWPVPAASEGKDGWGNVGMGRAWSLGASGPPALGGTVPLECLGFLGEFRV